MIDMIVKYVPLESSRLRLEAPRASHAAEIFRSFAADPEVTHYLKWEPARTAADSEAAMNGRITRLESGTEISWILVLKASDAVVGSVSLWPDGRGIELGFALARSAWGRGLAVEAVREVLGWLGSLEGIGRVWAACDVDNLRSKRVLEKLGFQHERIAEGFAVHPALGKGPRACHILSFDLAAA